MLEVAGERVIPGRSIRTLGQILVEFELETCSFDGGEAFGDLDHVGNSVALLNAKADFAVMCVVVVVVVRHEPFVDTKYAAWFEHAEDLRVDAFKGGGVNSGFDGVDRVERILGEGHLLEKG